jgi:hypothetical protein
MFEFKDVDVGAVGNGATTTYSYQLGANIGFGKKPIGSAGVSASVTWSTTWSTGSPKQPDRNENGYLDGFRYCRSGWISYPCNLRYGIHLVTWEFDFHQNEGWKHVNLAGAIILSILNEKAHERRFDHFQFLINSEIEWQTYKWGIGLNPFDWDKVSPDDCWGCDDNKYNPSVRLGDNSPSTDPKSYMLQISQPTGSPPTYNPPPGIF